VGVNIVEINSEIKSPRDSSFVGIIDLFASLRDDGEFHEQGGKEGRLVMILSISYCSAGALPFPTLLYDDRHPERSEGSFEVVNAA
jgi:hypothetical protein